MFFSGTLDPCIHRYMIKEAIADGNVLRFSVEYMRSISADSIPIQGFDPEKLTTLITARARTLNLMNCITIRIVSL